MIRMDKTIVLIAKGWKVEAEFFRVAHQMLRDSDAMDLRTQHHGPERGVKFRPLTHTVSGEGRFSQSEFPQVG